MNLSFDQVANDWQTPLATFFMSDIGQSLKSYLDQRQKEGAVIYPPKPFYALELTPLSRVRVVIVGQDPYHGPNQAQGLAFHVNPTVRIPPSLRNIHKELKRDLGIASPSHGALTGWAQQGVLLLNAVLTVEDGHAASHAKKGWETLTDSLLKCAAEDAHPKVFLLWGAYAQSKKTLIEASGQGHLILCANHPSPLSATRPPVPFIGCGHFSEANRWLASRGEAPIDWGRFSDEVCGQTALPF